MSDLRFLKLNRAGELSSESTDTVKFLFALPDKRLIESVLMWMASVARCVCRRRWGVRSIASSVRPHAWG